MIKYTPVTAIYGVDNYGGPESGYLVHAFGPEHGTYGRVIGYVARRGRRWGATRKGIGTTAGFHRASTTELLRSSAYVHATREIAAKSLLPERAMRGCGHVHETERHVYEHTYPNGATVHPVVSCPINFPITHVLEEPRIFGVQWRWTDSTWNGEGAERRVDWDNRPMHPADVKRGVIPGLYRYPGRSCHSAATLADARRTVREWSRLEDIRYPNGENVETATL